MNNYLKVFILLILITLAFFVGQKNGKEQVVIQYRDFETSVYDAFRIGCETMVMRSCHVNDLTECRQFCASFLEKNPKLKELLEKKPEFIE